jgi:hypothetical protein
MEVLKEGDRIAADLLGASNQVLLFLMRMLSISVEEMALEKDNIKIILLLACYIL